MARSCWISASSRRTPVVRSTSAFVRAAVCCADTAEVTANTRTIRGIVDMASIFERRDTGALSCRESDLSCLSTCGNASLSSGVVYRTVESDNLPDGRQRRPGSEEEGEEVAESGLDRRTPGREAGLHDRRHGFPGAGRARATARRLPRDDGGAPGQVPDGGLLRGTRPLPHPEALVRQAPRVAGFGRRPPPPPGRPDRGG